jgi:hypothetical protein
MRRMGFRGGLGLVVLLAVAILIAVGLLQSRGRDSEPTVAGSACNGCDTRIIFSGHSTACRFGQVAVA